MSKLTDKARDPVSVSNFTSALRQLLRPRPKSKWKSALTGELNPTKEDLEEGYKIIKNIKQED